MDDILNKRRDIKIYPTYRTTMGNMNCAWFDKDKRIHNAVDAAFKEFKKELLECVRAELTASRSQESEPRICIDTDQLPPGPPILTRQ